MREQSPTIWSRIARDPTCLLHAMNFRSLVPVTGGLPARGYRVGDVKKIMGGNWLRLYNEVWQS